MSAFQGTSNYIASNELQLAVNAAIALERRRQPDIHWVTEVEPQLQAISALQGLGITPA